MKLFFVTCFYILLSNVIAANNYSINLDRDAGYLGIDKEKFFKSLRKAGYKLFHNQASYETQMKLHNKAVKQKKVFHFVNQEMNAISYTFTSPAPDYSSNCKKELIQEFGLQLDSLADSLSEGYSSLYRGLYLYLDTSKKNSKQFSLLLSKDSLATSSLGAFKESTLPFWFGLGHMNKEGEYIKAKETVSIPKKIDQKYIWTFDNQIKSLSETFLKVYYPENFDMKGVPESYYPDYNDKSILIPYSDLNTTISFEFELTKEDPPGLYKMILVSKGNVFAGISFDVVP